MLEALICSGIHLNGLVEAYIIFDDLFFALAVKIGLVIIRYFSVCIGTGTCKIMLGSQITLDPVILLISYADLTFIFPEVEGSSLQAISLS